jgi:hypothetical protein
MRKSSHLSIGILVLWVHKNLHVSFVSRKKKFKNSIRPASLYLVKPRTPISPVSPSNTPISPVSHDTQLLMWAPTRQLNFSWKIHLSEDVVRCPNSSLAYRSDRAPLLSRIFSTLLFSAGGLIITQSRSWPKSVRNFSLYFREDSGCQRPNFSRLS